MSYQNLLKKLKKELTSIPEEIERKTRHKIVVRNWHIGQLIVGEYFKDDRIYAPRNEHLFERLSNDLGKNKRFLQYTVQFYRAYLKAPRDQGLTWTHYQYLLGIKDPEERLNLEKYIVKEKISSQAMKEFMGLRLQKSKLELEPQADELTCTRGIPYTYRITKVNYMPKRSSLITIDLGFYFDIHFPLTGRETFEAGHIVQVAKNNLDYHVSYKKATQDAIYTYKACMERIIDADTFKMHIDCGFKMWTHQTIRLRGVDAPERQTLRGKQAKKHVEATLKNVDSLAIKTYGKDSFGRYIADVFYLPDSQSVTETAQNGIFLNQELLDKGYALRF